MREAADRYDRGVKLFEEGDYKLAIVEFERAYELTGNFQVLYNVGEVHYQLGNYAASKTALLRYLKDGGSLIPEARQKIVAERLGQLKIRTATIRIVVNEPGAEVSLNGVPLGRSPLSETLVDSGTLRITVAKEGFRDLSQVVTLAGGDERSVSLALVPLPKAAPQIQESRSAAPAWIAWGATAAFAAGTVGFVFAWQGAQQSLDDEGNKETTRTRLDDLSSTRNTFRTMTFVFGGATLLAAATGVYFSTRPDPKSKAQARIAPTLGGLMVSGQF